MKILLCHNHYQQRGGEDLSFAAEADMLEARGHHVVRHTVHNDAIDNMSRPNMAWRTLWNPTAYKNVRQLIREHRPDVMHCTNTFPLLSPAVYYAARRERLPVVQSLRNYRLLCPNAYLLRDNKVCEDCLGKLIAWPGIRNKCYRGSRSATAVVSALSSLHRLIGTWNRAVDLYFTPTEFARGKFVQAGFPADRIAVKPNFIDPDPGIGDGQGGFAVFVGRLSPEKGIDTMVEAWSTIGRRLPLKIIGDGPLREKIVAKDGIECTGPQPVDEVLRTVGRATCLVMPSIWYETFGRTIVEAFAKGTPVIASRLGCMQELVEDGVNGMLFNPADAHDLAATVDRFLDDELSIRAMREAARRAWERYYTVDANYQSLMGIYQHAINGRENARSARTVFEQSSRNKHGEAVNDNVPEESITC